MLEAVIFDWAGTLVDFGSRAPLSAFTQLFANRGIEITLDEAREPMGTEKKEHIRRLLKMPRISQAWLDRYQNQYSEADIDQLYQELIPLQIEQINQHSVLIPGAVEVYQELKERNLKIGSTTGYGKAMIGDMLKAVEEQGFVADYVVAADEILKARPSAIGALKNVVELGISSVQACVKVDDTVPGIDEGRNAGMWTVAVVLSGNALGLSLQHWENTQAEEKADKIRQSYRNMESSGAHYLIDSVAQLPAILSDIELRMSRGERP